MEPLNTHIYEIGSRPPKQDITITRNEEGHALVESKRVGKASRLLTYAPRTHSTLQDPVALAGYTGSARKFVFIDLYNSLIEEGKLRKGSAVENSGKPRPQFYQAVESKAELIPGIDKLCRAEFMDTYENTIDAVVNYYVILHWKRWKQLNKRTRDSPDFGSKGL